MFPLLIRKGTGKLGGCQGGQSSSFTQELEPATLYLTDIKYKIFPLSYGYWSFLYWIIYIKLDKPWLIFRLMSDLFIDSFYRFAQPLTQKNVYLILNFKN